MTCYIDPGDQADLEPHPLREAMTASELSFQLTSLVDAYTAGNVNDPSIADVLGALDGTAREFYRRVATPYAEEKIRVNGDIFTTTVRPIGKLPHPPDAGRVGDPEGSSFVKTAFS